MQPLVVIAGTTGTGKTDLAVTLAQRWGRSILSADSQLVYQGLDIGTAKPTLAQQGGILHAGMNLVPPSSPFSTATFTQHALPFLQQHCQQGAPPIIVGGSGFYIKPLLQRHQQAAVPPNPAFRDSTLAWAQQHTPNAPWQALHQRLHQQDPQRAAQLEPKDSQRVLRALEVIAARGGQAVGLNEVPPLLQQALAAQGHAMPPVVWVGLAWENRPAHWQVLAQRVQRMLAAGWLEEVEALITRHGPEAHALQTAIGYPQLVQVIQGTLPLATATEAITLATRQYARRQRVWFKPVLAQAATSNPSSAHWLDPSHYPHTAALADAVEGLMRR